MSTTNNTSKQNPISQAQAIVILIVSTLIMIAAGFSNFKFPPILLDFLKHYGIEMGAMSVVMSVFQWVCIFGMIPAGLAISRLSARVAGVLSVVLIILGNVVGLVGTSIAMLVIGRVIEALGFCLISILTQSVVCSVFRGTKIMTTATGILNTGMMFGQMIHFNVAPRLVLSYGLNGVYVYIIVSVAVLAILWAILINGKVMKIVEAAADESAKVAMTREEKRAKKLAVYKTPQIWLVAVGFTCLGGAVARVGQFLPAYLTTELGFDSVAASGLVSISTAIGIAVFILYGIVADWLNTKRKLMIFSSLSVIAVYLCLMYLPAGLIMIFIILYGSLPRAFTTLTYSCYPDIFEDNTQIPIAHSVVHFVGNVIGALLTAAFGYIIQFAGYTVLWYFCMVLGVIAAVCWYFAKKVK